MVLRYFNRSVQQLSALVIELVEVLQLLVDRLALWIMSSILVQKVLLENLWTYHSDVHGYLLVRNLFRLVHAVNVNIYDAVRQFLLRSLFLGFMINLHVFQLLSHLLLYSLVD